MEYIISNITTKEWEILEDNNIDWFPDDLNRRDIVIEGESEYNRALELLGRK
jgi:hypothetical protein